MEAFRSEMTFNCAPRRLMSNVRQGSNIESARYCHYESRRRAPRYSLNEKRLHVLNVKDVRKEDGCTLMFERHSARARIHESRRSSASYSDLVKSTAFYSLFFFVSLSRDLLSQSRFSLSWPHTTNRISLHCVSSCRRVDWRNEREREGHWAKKGGQGGGRVGESRRLYEKRAWSPSVSSGTLACF